MADGGAVICRREKESVAPWYTLANRRLGLAPFRRFSPPGLSELHLMMAMLRLRIPSVA
jgi:hypothetical protein